MNTKPCRYCQASIRLVRIARSGRMMPIDADPNPHGNVVVYSVDGVDVAKVVPVAEPVNGVRYMPHFATCANLPKKRRRR